MAMASPTKLLAGDLASSCSFSRASPNPKLFPLSSSSSRVYFAAQKTRRFQVFAFDVKRSPKRLKYSGLRFTWAYVGVRMPTDAICQAILEKMDSPLLSTSRKCPKENECILDPVVIADTYGPEGLDFVVDGGLRVADPSTVVDMTVFPPKIIRQGKGPQLHWMVAEGDYEDDNEPAESVGASYPLSLGI